MTAWAATTTCCRNELEHHCMSWRLCIPPPPPPPPPTTTPGAVRHRHISRISLPAAINSSSAPISAWTEPDPSMERGEGLCAVDRSGGEGGEVGIGMMSGWRRASPRHAVRRGWSGTAWNLSINGQVDGQRQAGEDLKVTLRADEKYSGGCSSKFVVEDEDVFSRHWFSSLQNFEPISFGGIAESLKCYSFSIFLSDTSRFPALCFRAAVPVVVMLQHVTDSSVKNGVDNLRMQKQINK